MVKILHEIHTESLRNHIVIYGWLPHYTTLLKELRGEGLKKHWTILIIHLDSQPLENLGENVYFIPTLGSYETDLEAANIRKAHTLVISSYFFQKDEKSVNSQVMLIAILARKLHPTLRIVVDIPFGNHTQDLMNAGADEVVCAEQYCSTITAHTLVNPGISLFFKEVLSTQYGNEFYLTPFASSFYGKTFSQALEEIKEKHNTLLLGVMRGKHIFINPHFLTIEKNDKAIVLSESKVDSLG